MLTLVHRSPVHNRCFNNMVCYKCAIRSNIKSKFSLSLFCAWFATRHNFVISLKLVLDYRLAWNNFLLWLERTMTINTAICAAVQFPNNATWSIEQLLSLRAFKKEPLSFIFHCWTVQLRRIFFVMLLFKFLRRSLCWYLYGVYYSGIFAVVLFLQLCKNTLLPFFLYLSPLISNKSSPISHVLWDLLLNRYPMMV